MALTEELRAIKARMPDATGAALYRAYMADNPGFGGKAESVRRTARKVANAETPRTAASVETEALSDDETTALKQRNAFLRDQLKAANEALREARNVHIPAVAPLLIRPENAAEIRIFAGDLHGAYMLRPAVDAFLRDMSRLKPNIIVLLGDMLECGGFLAQHQTLGFVAEGAYTYTDDIAHTNWFLDELQARAPGAKIYYLEGNHEHRIEKWCMTATLRHGTDAKFLHDLISAQSVLHLAERGIAYLPMSEFYPDVPMRGTLRIGTDRTPVYATHGITACKHAAAKHVERFAANVVYGHTHRDDSYTINTVAHPVIGAWSPGCLCQRVRLWNHTQPDNWTHGYGLQVANADGRFQHTNVKIVDGESLLMPLLETGNSAA